MSGRKRGQLRLEEGEVAAAGVSAVTGFGDEGPRAKLLRFTDSLRVSQGRGVSGNCG